MIMTNNHKQHESRNIVDRVKVRVPLNSSQNVTCVHDCNYARLLIQNHSNFTRSAAPDRFMCYEDGSWVDLLGDALESVRSGFVERKPVVEVEIDGSKCLVDFYRMLIIDCDSEDQKSIAWIDVEGKCFFPKTFVSGAREKQEAEIGNVAENLSSEIPKIEIEIKLSESLNKRRRENMESESESEAEAEGSSSNDQSELKKRKLVLSDCESPRWPKSKLLKEGDKAFTIVKELFLSGLGLSGATITGIHQYSRPGPLDRARCEVFQKQIEITKAARGGEANMTFAWHATSAKGVESILAHGFGMPSTVPDSEACGIGIYLSPVRSPHVSAMLSEVDDYGEKHVILCRVILGKCEKVGAQSQQSYPSSTSFDTGVDDVVHPNWYVVWCANMNTHILPECVVSYRSSNHVPGQLNESPFSKWMPNASNPLTAMLFSKLGRSLPASKVLELRTLCGIYKEGKVTKDTFVRQLRSIVGDEMLLSAIREIRG